MPVTIPCYPGRTRTVCALLLAVLVPSGCGLAMNTEDRLDRAAKALAGGEYRATIIDAKYVLRREPDNVRGRLLLARASLAVHDGAEAEQQFRNVVELGTPLSEVAVGFARALAEQKKYRQLLDEVPPDVEVPDADREALNQLYGDAYLGLGQPDKAREFFDRVLQTTPENVDAKLGIVAALEAEENYTQARSNLDRILASHPDDVRAWLTSGRLNILLQSLDSAEKNFEAALRIAEKNQDTHLKTAALAGLADALLGQNKIDRGREIVARLESLAPNADATKFLDARIAYNDEDWPRAQQDLQEVLNKSPDNRRAQMLLGAVHLEKGDLAQAEMYLSGIVDTAPDNDEARRLLAKTRLLMHRPEEAQHTLQPLISEANADARSLSMSASASASTGDFESAIRYLERALDSNPGNPSLQFQLVVTYLGAGRDREAENLLAAMNVDSDPNVEFRRDALLVLAKVRDGDNRAALEGARSVAKKWPELDAAYYLLGSVQMMDADPESARLSFQRAAEITSNGVESRRYLAVLEESEGNLAAAHDYYVGILDDDPKAAWAMFALSRIAARADDSAAAIEWLQKFRAVDSNAVAPRAVLARLLVTAAKLEEAESVVDEALAIDDGDAALHNLKGEIEMRRKEYRSAATNFARATDIDKTNAAYRVNLARSQIELGNTPQALQIIDDSIDAIIADVPAAVRAAAIKAQQGDVPGAMAIAERLQKLYPNSPLPYALQGELFVQEGDLSAASKAYDNALDIDVLRSHALRSFNIRSQLGLANPQQPLERYLAAHPLDSEVRIALAEAYHQQSDLRRAIAEYDKILKTEPNNGIALNNLAWIYLQSGDDRAESVARRAYRALPERGSVADTLGWILVRNGSIDEGVDLLQKAVRLTSGKPEIRYHLAVGLSKAGRNDDARDMLEEILASEDEFDGRDAARKLLAQM